MRWLIYLHLAAVAICACLSLADRGLLWSLQFSQAAYPIAQVMLLPALIAWIACPLGAMIIAARSSGFRRMAAPVLAEVALFFAQVAALLPSVQ
ncbi:MAG: hypothetical protein JWP89_3490 [Schlesneria sp.]|nr:hypothetical protein [Schlesneria sp.]